MVDIQTEETRYNRVKKQRIFRKLIMRKTEVRKLVGRKREVRKLDGRKLV